MAASGILNWGRVSRGSRSKARQGSWFAKSNRRCFDGSSGGAALSGAVLRCEAMRWFTRHTSLMHSSEQNRRFRSGAAMNCNLAARGAVQLRLRHSGLLHIMGSRVISHS